MNVSYSASAGGVGGVEGVADGDAEGFLFGAAGVEEGAGGAGGSGTVANGSGGAGGAGGVCGIPETGSGEPWLPVWSDPVRGGGQYR